MSKDSIVKAVTDKFKKRSEVGIKKYNKTMDRDDLSLDQWLTHAQEEAMDLTLYLEKIKHVLNQTKMSRYTKELDNGKVIAYGYDKATGYFFQVFDVSDENKEDNLLIDECSMFTNMSNGKMIELMNVYELPESHLELVAMDLPI
jgi:hypothetical protein|tara:strand:+ start:55 stop:489 length:435 start_codon:yes stop_codon:yes gene_type:complete